MFSTKNINNYNLDIINTSFKRYKYYQNILSTIGLIPKNITNRFSIITKNIFRYGEKNKEINKIIKIFIFYNEKYNLLQLSGIKYLIFVHNIKQNLSNLLIITNNHNIPINHSKNFPNEKFDIFLFENSDYTKIENKDFIDTFKNNKTINNLFNPDFWKRILLKY